MRQHLAIATLLLLVVAPVFAVDLGFLNPAVKTGTVTLDDGRQLDFHKAGVTLSMPGDYGWWYGCSATSAGMMMGHYDVHGYGGLSYSNLVPGGNAENETYTGSPGWSALANNAIASTRHVSDFYVAGYGASGDDVSGAPTGSLDCLGDFMGTSQDAYGNVNGGTMFWFANNGSPTYVKDLYNAGSSYYNSDGMYGMFEYMKYAGYYTSQSPSTSTAAYSQYIDAVGLTYGFTFAQYQAEIDAGRPVIIQVDGHSMLGVGYQGSNTVELCDTWTIGAGAGSPKLMTWGGSYSGMDHYGVAVLVPMDGTSPSDPITVVADSGNWGLTSTFVTPNTLDIDKTANDMGPFDIQIQVTGGLDPITIQDPVLNSSGQAWSAYQFQLGQGLGGSFVASTALDGLNFLSGSSTQFPTVTLVNEDLYQFSGTTIPVSSLADFLLSINLPGTDPYTFTLRAWATAAANGIPEPSTLTLGLLAGLGLIALLRRQRR